MHLDLDLMLFSQDDKGYITHIIPPKEVPIAENAIEFTAIDVGKNSWCCFNCTFISL